MAKSGKEPAAEGAGKKSAVNKSVSAKSAATKSAAQKKATGKVKAVSSSAPRTSGAALVPVICSECHEDFMFDTGAKTDEIVCPICEHAAGRPDDAALHHIADKRATEKRNLWLAILAWVVGGGAYLAWVALMGNPANANDDATFMGPLVLAILLLIGGTALAVNYENNRHEVYF
jgi:hypothetical protein